MIPQFIDLTAGIRIVERLRRVGQRLTRIASDRMMQGAGISYARVRILALLARDGPKRPTDLTRLFGKAPRTITEAIDGLQRDGFVERENHVSDRRVRAVVITEAGREAVRRCYDVATILGEEIEAVLGDTDVIQLDRLLDQIEQLDGMTVAVTEGEK